MKLTTKLLLGATVVVGLSISAFAACAADVYMGNKQLKNVADGVDPGDAVNKGQLDSKFHYSVLLNDTKLEANTTSPSPSFSGWNEFGCKTMLLEVNVAGHVDQDRNANITVQRYSSAINSWADVGTFDIVGRDWADNYKDVHVLALNQSGHFAFNATRIRVNSADSDRIEIFRVICAN